MKYVKTYELFGDFFKNRKKLLLDKQEEIRQEKLRKEKEAKEVEKPTGPSPEEIKKATSERIRKDFIESVKNYLSSIKNSYIDKIDVTLSKSLDGERFNLTIFPNKEIFSNIKYNKGDININLGIKEASIEMSIYSTQLDKDHRNRTITKEDVSIYSDNDSLLIINAKEIINSKGYLGEYETSRVRMFKDKLRRLPRYGERKRAIVSKKLDTEDETNLQNIERYVNSKVASIGTCLERYITDKLEKLKAKERLDKFRQIDVDEIKEILADVLDMCEGDYIVDRKSDHFMIHGKIAGLSSHSDSGIKMNSPTIQVIRHIPEIKDRLNDINMDMDVHFGSTAKNYNIDIKVYCIGDDILNPQIRPNILLNL